MTLKDKINELPIRKLHLASVDRVELNDITRLENYDPSLYFRESIIEKGYKILELYACYYQGWECDEWAAMTINPNTGRMFFATTDHGSLVFEDVNQGESK